MEEKKNRILSEHKNHNLIEKNGCLEEKNKMLEEELKAMRIELEEAKAGDNAGQRKLDGSLAQLELWRDRALEADAKLESKIKHEAVLEVTLQSSMKS